MSQLMLQRQILLDELLDCYSEQYAHNFRSLMLKEKPFFDGEISLHLARVVYIGPIGGRKGEFVGIEFDWPGRGKNNGSVEGNKIVIQKMELKQFIQNVYGSDIYNEQQQLSASETLKETNQISFIKKENFQKLVLRSANLSVAEALKCRYIDGYNTDSCDSLSFNGLVTSKPIEFVGHEEIHKKQCDIQNLRSLSIPNALCVANVGDESIWLENLKTDILPKLNVFDISFSHLISNWEEILLILKRAPNLRKLSIHCFPRLDLSLSEIFVGSWFNIETLCSKFPNLEKLVLIACDVEPLPERGSVTIAKQLKHLILDKNPRFILPDKGNNHSALISSVEELSLNAIKRFQPQKYEEDLLKYTTKSLNWKEREFTIQELLQIRHMFPHLENLCLDNTEYIEEHEEAAWYRSRSDNFKESISQDGKKTFLLNTASQKAQQCVRFVASRRTKAIDGDSFYEASKMFSYQWIGYEALLHNYSCNDVILEDDQLEYEITINSEVDGAVIFQWKSLLEEYAILRYYFRMIGSSKMRQNAYTLLYENKSLSKSRIPLGLKHIELYLKEVEKYDDTSIRMSNIKDTVIFH